MTAHDLRVYDRLGRLVERCGYVETSGLERRLGEWEQRCYGQGCTHQEQRTGSDRRSMSFLFFKHPVGFAPDYTITVRDL